MVRSAVIIALALASAACAADDPSEYVVRLDLDQIAEQTAARDAAPGFESLTSDARAASQRPGPAEAAGIDR